MMTTHLSNLPGRPELLAKIQRSLVQRGTSKENYSIQLGLNIPDLLVQANELYLQYGEVQILDIGGNTSTAIVDLKDLIIESGVPEDKIKLNKIDLFKVQQSGVNFLQGNLEEDEFLIHAIKQLGYQSQGIIFMNQVSQYLSDRLKVIKIIGELLLKKGGTFHFNLVTTSFYSGDFPFSMLEEKLYDVIHESSGFDISLGARSAYSQELRVCEIKKLDADANLEMPGYRRKTFLREGDGLVVTAYNMIERTDIDTIKAQVETQEKIAKLI